MEKQKQNWYDKPITWGGYAKLAAIVYAISLVFSGIVYVLYWRPSWWTSFTETVSDKLSAIEAKIEERF